MVTSGSPTVRRRRLAAELRKLRGNRTGIEVARGLGWSTTKISRAEFGRESLPPSEIEKLIDFYGASEPLRARLVALAEDATQRAWWEDYADALTPEYIEYIGLEAEASSLLHWQSDVVPGLLQTEGYARQLDAAYKMVDPMIPPTIHERFLQVRQIRQERLVREPVLQLSTVVDEAVLLRGVGDRSVMREQLVRMVESSRLPNVNLRVLPLDREIALGGAGSFAILSFGELDNPHTAALGDVVSIESLNTEIYVEGEPNAHLFRLFFQALSYAALSPANSRDFIISTLERVWS